MSTSEEMLAGARVPVAPASSSDRAHEYFFQQAAKLDARLGINRLTLATFAIMCLVVLFKAHSAIWPYLGLALIATVVLRAVLLALLSGPCDDDTTEFWCDMRRTNAYHKAQSFRFGELGPEQATQYWEAAIQELAAENYPRS